MSETLSLRNRQILAKFLPNQQAIRAFEQLLGVVAIDLPDSIAVLALALEELGISEGLTSAKADQALASLQSISDSLQVLAMAPQPELSELMKKIEALELLTMAS